MITIEGLRYSYPDGTPALDGIDLEIEANETLGIVGPNGAGKTTLLLHLNGILQGEGRVNVAGLDVNDKNLPQIRRKVGLVFQEPDDQLFTPTVYEDVAFGLKNQGFEKEKIDEAVTQALFAVGMSGFEQKSSHHLSFGEKKRVSLATVLALSPDILVLDEPTSNLDPKSRREFINILETLPMTKLISTHDLELVLETCSRTAILDAGKLITSGPTRELLSNKELLESHALEVPLSLMFQSGISRLTT